MTDVKKLKLGWIGIGRMGYEMAGRLVEHRLIAIDLLGLGDSGAGYLIGALGLGSVFGGAVAFTLAGRRRLAPRRDRPAAR